MISEGNRHKGKTFLVTGGSRGIGWAISQCLAAEGANLMITARSLDAKLLENCRRLAEETGVSIKPCELELASAESIRSLVGVAREFGPIDGLVNNAGLTYNQLFSMTDDHTRRELFEVNVLGLLELTQPMVRLMSRSRRGVIVNISSTAAFEANKGRSVYGATKAAISNFSKALARESGPMGIRVNAVAPGITRTEMVANSMSDEVILDVVSNTALGRMAEPPEIAKAVSFLLSDEASYVSGVTLCVDGGLKSS